MRKLVQVSSYGDDRAVIEDLQARYLFALDFHDPDLYVSTFTPDGVLDYGSGEVKGREAIKEVIARMPKPAATPGLRAAAARHNISNIVIKVDADKAASRSYWFHYSNDNPQRKGVFDGFGHYEDELLKVNGKWLFTKRKIYNEARDEWAYKGGKESRLVGCWRRSVCADAETRDYNNQGDFRLWIRPDAPFSEPAPQPPQSSQPHASSLRDHQ
jgi:hypothetical protein